MTTQSPYRIMVRATGTWLNAGESSTLDKASRMANVEANHRIHSVYSVVDATGTVVFKPDYGASQEEGPPEGREITCAIEVTS